MTRIWRIRSWGRAFAHETQVLCIRRSLTVRDSVGCLSGPFAPHPHSAIQCVLYGLAYSNPAPTNAPPRPSTSAPASISEPLVPSHPAAYSSTSRSNPSQPRAPLVVPMQKMEVVITGSPDKKGKPYNHARSQGPYMGTGHTWPSLHR